MISDIKPLVSIYCLTYNHSEFIRDALEGFLMQKTNFPFEIIVYDDCSTDGNQDIIREYVKKYPDRFRAYLSDVNRYTKGPKKFAINKFLELACGQFVAFCEGDDYWTDPYKLQKQIDLFRTNPGMTYCFTNRIVKNEITCKKRVEEYSTRRYTQKDFLSGFNPGIQTVMFEIKWIKNVDLNSYQDINADRLYPYLATKDGYALCLQEVTAVYRVSPIGVSTSVALKKSPSDFFKHSCDDFYRFHESTGFPYRDGYMKASSNYAMRYLTKHKDFKFRLFYEMTSRYNGHQCFINFMWTMITLIKTVIRKSIKKCGAKIYSAWDWVVRKIKKTRFCSSIFELKTLGDLSENKILKDFDVPKYAIWNAPTTLADIFLFAWKDRLYAFYEYQSKLNAKGLIYMVSTSDGIKWEKPKKVLEEIVHLSFPSVFEDKGQVFMIPETSFLKEVRLYKSNDDLTSFNFVKTLLSGERFVDSCIYVKDGLYYLFTSVQHDDNSYDLRLYYSDSLEGEWILHPASPLTSGKENARNAGSVFEYNNMILRPAQECRHFYGNNTHLFKVTKISKESYEEEPFALDVIPRGWRGALGGHQLSIAVFKGKTYVGVDLLKRAYRLYDIIQTIKEKI